jgi:hypothetical protein
VYSALREGRANASSRKCRTSLTIGVRPLGFVLDVSPSEPARWYSATISEISAALGASSAASRSLISGTASSAT